MEKTGGKWTSEYAVIGQPGPIIDQLLEYNGWRKIRYNPKIPIWTDKYSNIINLLKL